MSRRTCIFCLREQDESAFNDEHVFPKAIGGAFTIQTVCTSCNSHLGTAVDALLTGHALIEVRRAELGLAGNSGTVPDPFSRGTLVAEPHLTVSDIVSGPGSLRVQRSVQRDRRPDGSERVRVTTDARAEADLVATTNTILKRGGLPPKSPEEIRPHIQHVRDPAPWVEVKLTIDLADYKCALAKIAYELAATWLGDAYLDDPAAGEFRRTLLCPDLATLEPPPACRGQIGPRSAGASPEEGVGRNEHLALLTPMNGTITALIHVFDVFEAVIVVSEDPDRYPGFTGRVLALDAVSRTCQEWSLAEFLTNR